MLGYEQELVQFDFRRAATNSRDTVFYSRQLFACGIKTEPDKKWIFFSKNCFGY